MKREIKAGPDSWTFSCEQCLEDARKELGYAIYMSECGSNAGLRKIYSNKADLLSRLIYMAEYGLAKEDATNFVLETDLRQAENYTHKLEEELEQTKKQAYEMVATLRDRFSDSVKTSYEKGWLAGASFMRDLTGY